MTTATDDLGLLRAFEPVVRYNRGELFYPAAVEGTSPSATCSSAPPRTTPACSSPGEVTPDRWSASRPRPAKACTCASCRSRSAASSSRDGGCDRIASGSAHPAGSRASVCSRGSSTRASPHPSCCAAPSRAARRPPPRSSTSVRASDPRYVYHGRVVRRNGWICLHYLYFYFMNDYRSTFYGVNDHEADWEQVFIYLEDAPDGPRPVWMRPLPTTTPATSCGAAGTTRRSRSPATTRSSTRAPGPMPRTSSAVST